MRYSKNVTKVMWFNNSTTIGIVLVDEDDQKIAYIKSVPGINEYDDIEEILDWGSKITTRDAEDLYKHLK